MTLFMTAATGVMTLVPVVMQTSYGLSTLQAGLFMAPGGLTIAAITAVVGRLYDRIGPRPLIVVGAVVDAVGLWVLASLAPGASIWLVLAAYLTVIVGQALIWTPLFAGSLGALSETLSSHGSAIVNTIQQLAGAAGIAIAFAVMTAASSTHAAGGQRGDGARRATGLPGRPRDRVGRPRHGLPHPEADGAGQQAGCDALTTRRGPPARSPLPQ
jgi:DHA2 family lincomycin resistance protein-like MFS transporter